ncbi:MAG: Hpt domain-containing protein, partial [Xanthomonadales bacterium]|nr:Hpt domain-containing protein [Xanthomonadales bacterium]
MSNNNEIDFTTLNWVKQELEDTLKQARQSLESYVEDPQDASLMRFCASYLHQVQGTLRMVELYGAAMVVEEMERLAQGILDGKVKQS